MSDALDILDDRETEYSDFDEDGVPSEGEYDDEIEIKISIRQKRKTLRIEDSENYSNYEAKLKPIVKRGTFEQFLAVYIPKKQDDEFFFGIACGCGRLDIAQHIYSNVDDLSINGDCDALYDSPLAYATTNCHTKTVRWLLTLPGINVDCYCGLDYPILVYTILYDFPSDIIMRLVELGAPSHAEDEPEFLPLHLAVDKSRLEIVNCLLLNGFNPCEINIDSMTAFEYVKTDEIKFILDNYLAIFLKYCFDTSGVVIDADTFSLFTDML